MQRFYLRIIEQMRWGQKRFVIFTACYMLLMTAAIMTTPTNATFMSETTVKGQVVMRDDFEEGSDKSTEEDRDDSLGEKEMESDNESEQEKREQAGDDSSLDEEYEGNGDSDERESPRG